MAGKYRQFDKKLLAWFDKNRGHATTAGAMQALGVKDETTKRHLSRRFSQLEDRGHLKCTIDGSARICTVHGTLPDTMAKQRWRPTFPSAPAEPESLPEQTSIRATTSDEYVARGGCIHRLPTNWDRPVTGSQPLGAFSMFEALDAFDSTD